MNNQFFRSKTNKKLGGVCGGLSQRFGIDTTLLRVIWFVLAWFYGAGLVIYLACWVLMPEEGTF